MFLLKEKTLQKAWKTIHKKYIKYGIAYFQKQPTEVFYKKAVLKDFAILAGKHLFWSLFLISCQSFKKETPTQVSSYEHCKTFKNIYYIFKNMYERLFLYFRILKKLFFWKMKQWQIENSEKPKISENLEKLFRVFNFVLQPKSKTRI